MSQKEIEKDRDKDLYLFLSEIFQKGNDYRCVAYEMGKIESFKADTHIYPLRLKHQLFPFSLSQIWFVLSY